MIIYTRWIFGSMTLTKTKECACKWCSPIPGIFAKRRLLLTNKRTFAKVRLAELGFLGDIIAILYITPFDEEHLQTQALLHD